MSKRPSTCELIYCLSTIRHHRADDIQPKRLQAEDIRKHVKLMDLLALLIVTEKKSDVVALTFDVDSKASKIYVFYARNTTSTEAQKIYVKELEQILSGCIGSNSSPDRLGVANLVWKNAKAKILSRYAKLRRIVAQADVSVNEPSIPVAKELNKALENYFDKPITSPEDLPRIITVAIRDELNSLPETIDDDNQFKILYFLFSISNGSGRRLLYNKEIFSAIAKLGDYHAGVRKVISYLHLFADGTKLHVEDVTQKPSRTSLQGESAVEILNKYAKSVGERSLTKQEIVDAFPGAERNLTASGPKCLNEVCHAELSVAVHMIQRRNESNTDVTGDDEIPKTAVVKIGVSKACCYLCSKYIQTFTQMTGHEIFYSNSHGKIFAGWKIPASAELSNILADTAREIIDHEMETALNSILRKRKADSLPILSSDDETPAGLDVTELRAIKRIKPVHSNSPA